jgi:hypothetical protein
MPSERPSAQATEAISFDSACSLVEAALNGSFRRQIVAAASDAKDLGAALVRLRARMRSHVWTAGAQRIDLERLVRTYDSHTCRDGFHALHDWDGQADKLNDDTIPVDVLNYLIDKRGTGTPDHATLAIVVDYYFLYVLALLSLRLWDDDHADENLDRLTELLRELQGPHGSGQQFAENAETLILIASSHYELDDRGFDTLLHRVRGLNGVHRTNVALSHAASLGSHLRFGFEATYGRDTVAMRDDNVTDYPWLCFALAILMGEYSRMRDARIEGPARERVVEGVLNGLSPDARGFVGTPPASLSACEDERARFCDLFHSYRDDLLEEFERHRPTDQAYSPLSFFFNFSHNVLKGTVVDAALRGNAWHLTLNDLLTGVTCGEPNGTSRETLAKTLMGHARSRPDKIRGRLTPVIVYDPQSGRRAFATTMRKISGGET